MSIGIAVSFEASSNEGYRIVMLRTDSSTVTVTTLAVITKDGMNFIRTHGLKEMLDLSGLLEIAERMATGDKTKLE